FVLRALMSCACCADLRVVHSLPTRRSSDLNGGHAGSGWPPSPIIGSPRRRGAARLAALAHVLCELGQMPPFGESRPAARRDRCLDRKSTRLNSSHVSISYAVFCLKKKNTTR